MQVEAEPDTQWVSQLAGCTILEATRVLEEAARERRLFGHLAREHLREGRPSYVEIDAPLELYAIVRRLRPRHVVEVGVSSGVSSAYILQALARNERGTLHSIDRPKHERPSARNASRVTTASWALPAGRESGWAVPTPLRVRWDLRIGDKRVVIPLLAEELDKFELFVYDVPHDDRTSREEFSQLDPSLTASGVVIADHGPGGGLCEALRWWARRRRALPQGRRGTGLYGFRSSTRRFETRATLPAS
jgi:Methyltransferase domain